MMAPGVPSTRPAPGVTHIEMDETIEVWTEEKGVRTLTKEEFVAEFGAEEWAIFRGENVPELSPEDAKRLGEKMQQQAEVNAKLARDGLTLDDLFVEGDDEGGDLSDFEGREYDWEGALRDLDEREAREREEREA